MPVEQSAAMEQALRARGRARRAPRVRGRRSRVAPAPTRSPTTSSGSTRSSRAGSSRVEPRREGPADRRLPGPEARRRPRGAARARRGRRHARGRARRRSPTRSPTRASRRCASTSRTAPRAGARPTVRRCSIAAVREAAAELARRSKVPPDRLVLGGRSMGGRIASMVAADADDPLPALGLVLLGYPLHPPGKPETLRVEHFPRLRDAGAVRERHARRLRHARRAEAAREEGEGPGHVPLGRDRRPRRSSR